MERQTDAINIESMSKTYISGSIKVKALKDINISVQPSERLAILGPSGAGKTTFLNVLGGITNPNQGEGYIKIFGEEIHEHDIRKLSNYRKNRIGFIFQFYNLFPSLTAIENVMISIEPLNKHRKEKLHLYDIAKEYLEMVGLGERIDHYPSQLSGGEQQRVAIARALAKIPFVGKEFILLCDEPTGNLDTNTGEKIINLIEEINEKEKVTCVLVTHNPALAKRFATKTIYIEDGTMRELSDGTNPICD